VGLTLGDPLRRDAVTVDGVLDEGAWQTAARVEGWSRFQPTPGGPPAETLDVRVLQTEGALVFGVRVSDTSVPVRARFSQREDLDADDQIGIYLDPFDQARQGFIFYVNPLGVQQDLRHDNGEWQISWNAVFQSRGRVDADGHGFTLEVAIPFSALKYPSGEQDQTWGLILTRKVPAEGAKYGFPTLVRGHPQVFRQSAALDGVRPTARASGVQLIPALTFRGEQTVDDAGAAAWTPLRPWGDWARPQLDVRAGLGTGFGLVATVNPDFSQVESDVLPVVLNRRFAWRYPEQRPFFTEGALELADPGKTLYSRSIAEPWVGARVQGRADGWNIAALHVLDRAPTASFHEGGTPGFATEDVEGRWAANTLLRVRRDLPGSGQLGLTFADKRLVEGEFQRPQPGATSRGAADHLGVDVLVPLGDRWTLTAGQDQSIAGNAEAVVSGTRTGLVVERPTGRGLGVYADAAFLSEGYRQELGFLNQSGLFRAVAEVDGTLAGRGALSTWSPGVEAEAIAQVNGESYVYGLATFGWVIRGVHAIHVGGGWNDRQERPDGSAPLDRAGGPAWRATVSTQAGRTLELMLTADGAREMDFLDRRPTWRTSARLDAAIRAGRHLRIDALARWGHWDRVTPTADGTDVRDDLLLRARTGVSFDKHWSLRWIAAYNLIAGQAPTLETNLLATWMLHPFTAVYVGYAQLDRLPWRDDGGATTSRSLFLKGTVWWQPTRRTRGVCEGVDGCAPDNALFPQMPLDGERDGA
jgi:hypothetical protein